MHARVSQGQLGASGAEGESLQGSPVGASFGCRGSSWCSRDTLCYAIVFPGRKSTGKAPESAVRPAEGRPECRFRCFPGSNPSKTWPGRPIYGPEALLRSIVYQHIEPSSSSSRYDAGKYVSICRLDLASFQLHAVSLRQQRPRQSQVKSQSPIKTQTC